DGRWRLREQVTVLMADEPVTAPVATLTASSIQHLKQGCYVVFDLEAIGQDARSPATEIIQIAAWRFIDGLPQEPEPWSTFVRPGISIPANIVELTQISM